MRNRVLYVCALIVMLLGLVLWRSMPGPTREETIRANEGM
jgi:hypothetical protein